jgi:hypothetical protein
VTRYRVLISDEMLAQALEGTVLHWPDGFRIIDTDLTTDWAPVREITVEDDDAPEELAGRLVDVVLQRDVFTHKVTVASRTAVDE